MDDFSVNVEKEEIPPSVFSRRPQVPQLSTLGEQALLFSSMHTSEIDGHLGGQDCIEEGKAA